MKMERNLRQWLVSPSAQRDILQINGLNQLQQREMTPDNARIVEQKLLEFQKQQEAVSQVSVRYGD